MAVQAVGSVWATHDAAAAREWVLSQPPGEGRDGALVALISTSARFGAPDASLLGQLSTDQSRFGAVQSAAVAMAQRDPDGARAFVESNVTDPEQRQRVMSIVSQISSRRVGGAGGGIAGMSLSMGSIPPGFFPPLRPGDAPRPAVTSQGQTPAGGVQRDVKAPANRPTDRRN
jgi:hypothetical protein